MAGRLDLCSKGDTTVEGCHCYTKQSLPGPPSTNPRFVCQNDIPLLDFVRAAQVEGGYMAPFRMLVQGGLMALVLLGGVSGEVHAANRVSVPIFTEAQESNRSGVDTIAMSWDQGSAPDPLLLQWQTSHVMVRGEAFEPLMEAFDYAMAYDSTTMRPTGTLSLSTTLSTPLKDDGLSAGAALAVGFLAVLRGDRLTNEVALVGALEPTGRIGQVRRIRAKIRAAARQGYRVVLVPRGQRQIPTVRFVGMGVEPNITVREVGTVEEAYEIMTGKRLQHFH